MKAIASHSSRKSGCLRFVLFLAVALSCAPVCRADEIVCTGSSLVADARVWGTTPNTNYGLTTPLTAGAESGSPWRSFIKFDLAQCLPPGAVLQSATLKMTPVQANSPAPYQLDIGAPTASWAEGTVTWANQPALGPVVSSTICSDVNGEISFDVTSLVAAWWANPASNLGLYLKGHVESTATAYYFASRESTNFPERRPTLHITLSPTSDSCWSDHFELAESGVNGWVNDFEPFQGLLYAGGRLVSAGGVTCQGVAAWNGTTWVAVGTGMFNTYDLQVFNNELWGAGEPVIRRWNGSAWVSTSPAGQVHCYELTIYQGGLVACTVDAAQTGHVWSWNGSSWAQLGGTFNGKVLAIMESGGVLLAAGEFTSVGGTAANRIARWTGSSWVAVGTGANSYINSLTRFGSQVVAGGAFTTMNGVAAEHIAAGAWDGANWTWSALGSGCNAEVSDARVVSNVLVTLGAFTVAGGVVANRVAVWDGLLWRGLGSGFDASASVAAEYGGALYVGGTFGMAGGKPSSQIARWDCPVAPCLLSVTSPNGGESYCDGQAVNIAWSTTGTCSQNVRIALQRNGVECAAIASSTPNDGNYSWTASACSGWGAGYRIAVSEVGGSVVDASDGTFAINPGCSIALMYPNGGESLNAGDVVQISWNAASCCGAQVSLELLRAGLPCVSIAGAAPNTGTYTWVAAQCGEDSNGYTIRVTDLTSGLFDTSDATFRLLPAFRISKIADIGNDQGRSVRVSWRRSEHDGPGSPSVLSYSIFRREAGQLAARAEQNAGAKESSDPGRVNPAISGWDFVRSEPANGDSAYQMVVPTLCDSTAESGTCWSTFMIRATTSDPLVYFDCRPDSGYSKDNLAPNAPGNLRWQNQNDLQWDESEDIDFRYFTVFGSTSESFDPEHAVMISQQVDRAINVSTHSYPYYHITSTDFAGNRSEAAATSKPSGTPGGGIPTEFHLYEVTPNPARGSARIRFDLPRRTAVSIEVYDVAGRLVSSLLNSDGVDPGRHSVDWDGRGVEGVAVPSGLYFCRVRAGQFGDVERLLKIN